MVSVATERRMDAFDTVCNTIVISITLININIKSWFHTIAILLQKLMRKVYVTIAYHPSAALRQYLLGVYYQVYDSVFDNIIWSNK